MSLRILLADDHKMFRDGLRPLLEQNGRCTVVGEAETGLQAVRLAVELQPDLVVMDLSMPEMGGIEATRRIRERAPDARIVVLSMHADHRFVVEALRAGASAYVLKEASFAELEDVMRSVCAGRYYLSPQLNQQIIQALVAGTLGEGSEAIQVLSDRECEVLRLLAEGLSTKLAAERLCLSAKTVETHRKHIMDKLDLHSIAELTRFAIREGLIALD